MSNKNLLNAAFSSFAALAIGTGFASSADAAQLAYYGNGTDIDAAALANIAPAVAGTTVSDLSDVGAQTGDASRITRDTFGTDTPAGPTAGSGVKSEWFEARSVENQGAPSSTDNYFVFTVDADGGSLLNLTSLKYDFWLSDANNIAGEADAEAFVSVDNGAFVSVGSIQATDTLGLGASAPVSSANFDLSSISGASSVEVRIGIGYSTGNNAALSGFVQGIQLDGDVVPVPEPSSLALIGLGGLLAVRRRRG